MPRKALSAAHKAAISRALKGKKRGGSKAERTKPTLTQRVRGAVDEASNNRFQRQGWSSHEPIGVHQEGQSVTLTNKRGKTKQAKVELVDAPGTFKHNGEYLTPVDVSVGGKNRSLTTPTHRSPFTNDPGEAQSFARGEAAAHKASMKRQKAGSAAAKKAAATKKAAPAKKAAAKKAAAKKAAPRKAAPAKKAAPRRKPR